MSDDTEHIARWIRETSETVTAPDRLRARVAEETARRAPARRRRLLGVGGALAGATAAVVVALVLIVGSGGGPAMGEAVALAQRPPTTNAPAVDPNDPRHVEAAVGGVRFPTYPGWSAVGSRTDDLDGRRAVTVTYRGKGGPVAYTIVDGAPLEVPDDADWREYGGHRLAMLGDGVITWEQGGRTCIVAGSGADVAALLRAADQA